MEEEQLEIARLLLQHFRGRDNVLAVGGSDSDFAPFWLDKPLDPSWLVRRHLARKKCLGFYLMTEASKVYCTCVDFDNKPNNPDPSWRSKAEAVHLWLANLGLFPLSEISASGNGAHVWLFLAEATPAWLVREWWNLVSEKTGILFREVYPRQDVLSGKGLGNLVRYPLWNKSHFADPEDEWTVVPPLEILPMVRKTNASELCELAHRLGKILTEKPQHTEQPQAHDDLTNSELSPRVQQRLARKETLLARRWDGDTTGLKDTSRSAIVQSIATELVRQFVPTPEIVSAIAYWCQRHGYEEKGTRPDWINRTVSKAYEFCFQRVEERSAGTSLLKDAAHSYVTALASGQNVVIPSGIPEIDASVEGASYGEMVVIAARPGHGKTTFAVHWLDKMASTGVSCLLISEEMSVLELGKKVVTYISFRQYDTWKSHITELRSEIDIHFAKSAPIYVVENCSTIERAETVIDQFCTINGTKIVAVDYMGLLRGRGGEKRYELITDVSARLKQAAKRNNIIMLALCQLNRELDKRPGFEPQLSDLRDSGGVEQDADLILFLVWPWKYDQTKQVNDYKVYAKKRRNGPIKNPEVSMYFWPERQLFCKPQENPFCVGEQDEFFSTDIP